MWRPKVHSAAVDASGHYKAAKQYLSASISVLFVMRKKHFMVHGGCIAIYMSGLIVQNCSFVPIQTAQNSLKNQSGDIWIFLKTELAIYSGDCCFSNEVKGKNIPQNWKPAWHFYGHPFFSALWKNNTQQEGSKLWIYAKLLGTIWNEAFLNFWDLDFSHLLAALSFSYPYRAT